VRCNATNDEAWTGYNRVDLETDSIGPKHVLNVEDTCLGEFLLIAVVHVNMFEGMNWWAKAEDETI
jgi:hypothetical protein